MSAEDRGRTARSILFKNIDVLTGDGGVLYNANVVVSGGVIAYVGTEMPESGGVIQRVVPGRGRVLMPGLVNAHTHVPMTAMRGYADDVPLSRWLSEFIFPVEDRLDARAARVCAEIAAAEMIRSGTVSFSDQYFFCDEIARTAAETGLKANISRGTVGGPDFDRATDARLRENVALYDQWNGYDGGRIRVDFAVHAEYTSVPAVWEAVADEANARGAGITFHLSETKGEQERCLEKYGETPTALFEKAGLLGPRTVAAHGVWCSPEDLAILARTGTSVCHCPCSNLKLGSGIAPVKRMLEAGINVCLGTDGAASNNSLDMFGEMKTAALLAKGAELDPTVLPAPTAAAMAAVNGARSQGRETCGLIREGYDADLILVNTRTASLTPNHEPYSTAVYAAVGKDVEMTMVNGRILYEQGDLKTLDWERVRAEFFAYAAPKLFRS